MDQQDALNVYELRRELRNVSRRSEDLRFLNRLHCLVLVAGGNSCNTVAKWTGENPRTIQLWVSRYKQFGLKGLKERSKTAGVSKLDEAQANALRQELHRDPRKFGLHKAEWDGPLLKQHLEQHYSVDFSLRHCQRLLRESQQSRAESS